MSDDSKMPDLVKLLADLALAGEDPEDRIQFTIAKGQELVITFFSLYILYQAKEHEDCNPGDCNVHNLLPGTIDNFMRQFEKDLREHVDLNLKVNGFTLEKTHNQKTHEEICKEMGINPQAD